MIFIKKNKLIISLALISFIILLTLTSCNKSFNSVTNGEKEYLKYINSSGIVNRENINIVINKSNELGLRLFNKITNNLTILKNSLISPLEFSDLIFALSKISLNKTSKEIKKTFNINNTDQLLPNFGKIMFDYDVNRYNITSIANAFWINRNFKITDDSKNFILDYFRYNTFYLDYKDSENSAKKINYWTSNRTEGAINKIIESNNINPNLKIIIQNVFAFKDIWLYEFDSNKTTKKYFYSYNITEIDMMTKTSNFNYYENNKLKAIEIPYENQNFSMLILLPKTSNNSGSIADLNKVQNLNIKDIYLIINKLKKTNVFLQIPKFEHEQELNLKDILKEYNITKIFTKDAQLDLLDNSLFLNNPIKKTEKNSLFINYIIQKTKISLNETGVKNNTENKSLTYKYFIADHPFIYLVIDKSYNIPLITLIGNYVKP